ncbi:hypothetical protein HPB49_014557 [Dermacentor silvarum]|uniref:Uncharacterized protein n=1 Tax=Dermacentor silvarum TaxID=543639 RepID=A0ACB8CRS9_DERSI|nr:hypothetical protein HPB49_014557 [Dermacentor silvarum]
MVPLAGGALANPSGRLGRPPGTLNFLLKMPYYVDGEDIAPEKVTQEQGWRSARVRRVGANTRTADSNAPSPQPGARRGKSGGGLDISKIGAVTTSDAILAAAVISQEDLCQDTLCPNLQQNIMVASTPKRENASRYVRMSQILTSGKGVIRNIDLQDGPEVVDAKLVNTNNPLALAAKRIAQTGTVIIAYDGHRVPNFVRHGPLLLQCSLYRKQIDLCYTCGRLGHRADVCPTPGDAIFRGCGARSPEEQHQCTPKCKLCGGQHLTASKECAQRFKIPNIVRRRRSERCKMAGADPADEFQRRGRCRSRSRSRGRSGSRGRSASRGRSGSRSRSTGWACSRGRSDSRPRSSSRPGHDTSGRIRSRSRTPTSLRSKKQTLSWADMARGGREAPRGDDLRRESHHANELEKLGRVNEQLRKENSRVKQEMSRLAAEMAGIRKLALSPSPTLPASVPVPVAMDTSEASHGSCAPKHRAVENIQEAETIKLLSELNNAVASMQACLEKVQEAIAHLKMGLGALSERISKLEEVDASPAPSQVAVQRNVLAPSTEGAILRAALSAQPSPQPRHGYVEELIKALVRALDVSEIPRSELFPRTIRNAKDEAA